MAVRIQNRLNTREEILETSAKLFAKYGYFGVSMSDVAKHLKISKAALYYHFAGKEEIYEQVLKKTFRELWSMLKKSFSKDKTPFDNLFSIVESYILFSLQKPEISLFFRDSEENLDKNTLNIVNAGRKKLISLFKNLIKTESKGRRRASSELLFLINLILSAIGKGLIIATLPPRLIAEQLVNIILPTPGKKKKRPILTLGNS